ncbi:uncharacterized protein LOC142329843 [Lycorma delicatula]|uniref:uncharacterized protein LOC142329843 n=1 Tax=Lycorma delicatula TaxID=130591 RepID=UPI003F511172
MSNDLEKKRLLCDDNCQCGNSSGYCRHVIRQCGRNCQCGITLQDCKCEKIPFERSEGICKGAASILSERINHLTYVICCTCIIVIAICVLVLIMYNFFTKDKIEHSGVKEKQSSLCKRIVDEQNSILMGYNDIESDKFKKFTEPTRNVFYIINKPLTKEKACHIESVLKLLTDKLVYIIELNEDLQKRDRTGEPDYITNLQKYYMNLNVIKTSESQFFHGSLFENDWRSSSEELCLLAAKALAVWQFGGAAISENLLMNSRDIFDQIKTICFADKDIIYCPQECSAYTYQLMKEILKQMKTSQSGEFKSIIDKSISDFCSNKATRTGCNRVYRLQNDDMCEGNSGNCKFFRTKNMQKLKNYQKVLKRFCPNIMLD